MDYETYKKTYFVDPPPEPRFAYEGIWGAAIYVKDRFEEALAYYTRVLGPPSYEEGAGTRSWTLGGTTFTLLKEGTGGPTHTELILMMKSPEEAERLHAAFIEAGGHGAPPSDQLMVEPLRYCPVTDPFGMTWLVVARRPR